MHILGAVATQYWLKPVRLTQKTALHISNQFECTGHRRRHLTASHRKQISPPTFKPRSSRFPGVDTVEGQAQKWRTVKEKVLYNKRFETATYSLKWLGHRFLIQQLCNFKKCCFQKRSRRVTVVLIFQKLLPLLKNELVALSATNLRDVVIISSSNYASGTLSI